MHCIMVCFTDVIVYRCTMDRRQLAGDGVGPHAQQGQAGLPLSVQGSIHSDLRHPMTQSFRGSVSHSVRVRESRSLRARKPWVMTATNSLLRDIDKACFPSHTALVTRSVCLSLWLYDSLRDSLCVLNLAQEIHGVLNTTESITWPYLSAERKSDTLYECALF